jgi:uncharacterized protein YutD
MDKFQVNQNSMQDLNMYVEQRISAKNFHCSYFVSPQLATQKERGHKEETHKAYEYVPGL